MYCGLGLDCGFPADDNQIAVDGLTALEREVLTDDDLAIRGAVIRADAVRLARPRAPEASTNRGFSYSSFNSLRGSCEAPHRDYPHDSQ